MHDSSISRALIELGEKEEEEEDEEEKKSLFCSFCKVKGHDILSCWSKGRECRICKKEEHIIKYCPERRNGCFNCGELGYKKYECTKEEGGAYVDPVLEGNGMAVTYMSGVRNLEELEEKMRKENEEKA